MRSVAVGLIVVLGLTACAGEPSDRVAVPGAPPGGDTRPAINTAAGASTTDRPAASTTTLALTPSLAPTTVATTSPVSTLPVTTVPEPTTTPAPTTTELVYSPEPADGPLTVGVEGPRSLLVQQQLVALAILPSTAADSKFGPGTAAGIRRFQEAEGLIIDGVAGPITVIALAAAFAALAPPPTTA
jgi:peptidoglycan hydrolase-like protein with peptidoglycan-binding domain